MLPAPLAKLIWVWPEERAEKIGEIRSEDPEISGEPLRATPQKFWVAIIVTVPAWTKIL